MPGELSHPVVNALRRNLLSLGVTKDSKILAGVSGGVDSMVLLYSLHKAGYSVSAAHVNFNLRGAESVNDALFVKNWCLELDIPYIELSKDTQVFAESNNLNTQTAARNIRYEWWEYLVRDQGFDFVATAHHLDDTIETLFLNLLRGTGVKGLRGIPSTRDFYIRPLLECSKTEIESFAELHAIPFRTDSSNLTDHYQRNRLRHHLIPLLEELYPGFHSSMKHTLHRINIEWDTWEHSYADWQSTCIKMQVDGLLVELHSSQLAFSLRWLEEKGIPWSLTYDFLNNLMQDSGRVLHYDRFRLSQTEKGFFLEEVQPAFQIMLEKPGRYTFGNFSLSIAPVSSEAFTITEDPWIEYVDAEAIQWPLTIRNVRPGDHFQPIGMKGKTKKIQDLMVDRKMELFEKERLLILADREHIIWVIGLRLDEKVKVNPASSKIYRLVYSPVNNA